MRSETQVSKADPTVKKIIGAIARTDGYAWKGRKIGVVQVDPGFTYQLYNDSGEPHVFRVHLHGLDAVKIPKPTYGGPATKITAPREGEVIVVRHIGNTGSMTIYVPDLGAGVLDVARDAIAAGDKAQATKVLRELGPYAGIGMAIVSSQEKTLEKVASGKTSRQIAREVDELLRQR